MLVCHLQKCIHCHLKNYAISFSPLKHELRLSEILAKHVPVQSVGLSPADGHKGQLVVQILILHAVE